MNLFIPVDSFCANPASHQRCPVVQTRTRTSSWASAPTLPSTSSRASCPPSPATCVTIACWFPRLFAALLLICRFVHCCGYRLLALRCGCLCVLCRELRSCTMLADAQPANHTVVASLVLLCPILRILLCLVRDRCFLCRRSRAWSATSASSTAARGSEC